MEDLLDRVRVLVRDDGVAVKLLELDLGEQVLEGSSPTSKRASGSGRSMRSGIENDGTVIRAACSRDCIGR